MILSTIKTYALVAVGAVGSVLLIALRVLSGQNRKLRAKNKRFDAQRKHTQEVMEQDTAIDEQADEHLSDVAHDVEEAKKELTKDEW